MGPLRTFRVHHGAARAHRRSIGGAVLSWARALGEFGATIMFAGNLQGVSQTLPLAVYLNLESGNLPVAVVLSVILILFSLIVVVAVHVTADAAVDLMLHFDLRHAVARISVRRARRRAATA